MRTETLATWSDIKQLIDGARRDADFVWRGQSDAAWLVSSTLYRYFESRGVRPEERVSRERAAIETFRSHFSRSTLFDGNSRDSLAHLILMQHYGCPTRLIDWTWSPYIAAYFAVHEAATDSALYGLNLSTYQPRLGSRLPLDDYDGGLLRHLPDRIFDRLLSTSESWPIPVTPPPQTTRQFDQQSVFLLDLRLDAPTERMLEEIAPDAVLRIIIPAAVRAEAADDLRFMNIDGYHLFRGRQGVALNARDALNGMRENGSRIETFPLDP